MKNERSACVFKRTARFWLADFGPGFLLDLTEHLIKRLLSHAAGNSYINAVAFNFQCIEHTGQMRHLGVLRSSEEPFHHPKKTVELVRYRFSVLCGVVAQGRHKVYPCRYFYGPEYHIDRREVWKR